MSEPACGNCRFWRSTTAARSAGECHRYPPAVVTYREDEDIILKGDIWPRTSATQWCGEHQGVN